MLNMLSQTQSQNELEQGGFTRIHGVRRYLKVKIHIKSRRRDHIRFFFFFSKTGLKNLGLEKEVALREISYLSGKSGRRGYGQEVFL